jgi:hypothetical protein
MISEAAMNTNPSERGQAIVLIILAIVAMFGFAALAVDGSRIYAERRRAQTAADSAAYAAALAGTTEQDWRQVAHAQLMLNGYTDVDYSVVNPGKRIDVAMFNPPRDADTGRYDVPEEYFQVVITTTVDPVFAQIVTNGPFRMTVEAVAQGRSPSAVTPGRAMFSTSPNGCSAMKFHGNQSVRVIGGDIYSSSGRSGGQTGSTDPNSCCAISQDGGNTVTVEQGGVYAVGSYCGSNNSNVVSDNGLYQNAPRQDVPTLPLPNCTHDRDGNPLPERSYSGGDATLQPGIYRDGIRLNGRYTVTLTTGLYCLHDDLWSNGGRLIGNEVMIVMMDGSINLGGNTTVRLTQHPTLEDGSRQTWGGMLFYMPYNNGGYIGMSGNAGTVYTGTVYAPGPRTNESQTKCTVTGTANGLALSSSLICYSLDVGGTADVVIYYREEQNYKIAPSLNLAR